MSAFNTFKTHPSVRIKGTESVFNPVQCIDPMCHNKSTHMHCPFCTKVESFHDPLILKAHYRVKHVDKGIEFAGLKILRCCEQCDMVGAIKGEKKFKGAHWHCYRCRNGFNRRDEAIKHYKTHFRNPQTTFQIQISQEVNPIPQYETSFGEDFTVRSNLPTNVLSHHMIEAGEAFVKDTEDNVVSGKDLTDVSANETIGAQTIMIIEEHPDGSLHHETARAIEFATPATDSLQFAALLDERARLEKTVEDLTKQNELLELEKSEMKENHTVEVEQLKLQVAVQANAITNYQKREHELLNQLTANLDDKTQQLMNQLERAHKELLRNHITQARRTYLQQLENGNLQINVDSESTTNSTTLNMQLTTMCLPQSNTESEMNHESTNETTWEIAVSEPQNLTATVYQTTDNNSAYSVERDDDSAAVTDSDMVIVSAADDGKDLDAAHKSNDDNIVSEFVINTDNSNSCDDNRAESPPPKIRKTTENQQS
ncbi:uncharacterized protein LOC141899661 [Tubulanus polymorphus]|uniref:uncharacterized protein LOC141899661 n=1 Tax=Tubulanus polymorphus TaxID=672921 RepID=UPI003DA584F4